MSLKSMFSRFKSKRTTKAAKIKMLKKVEKEAFLKERELKKQEKKAIEAENLLKQVEAAKKRGVKKARINGKTISIKNAVSKAKSAKKVATSGYRAAHKAYRVTDEVLTQMGKMEFFALPWEEPPKKRKAVGKFQPKKAKKAYVKKKSPVKKPVQKQILPVTTKPKKHRKYVITHTPTGKTRTVHALGHNEAKEMAKQLLGLNSIKKLVARQV